MRSPSASTPGAAWCWSRSRPGEREEPGAAGLEWVVDLDDPAVRPRCRAPGAQVTAHVHQHAGDARDTGVEERGRHLVGRRALADPTEIERDPDREAHRRHQRVELDVAAARHVDMCTRRDTDARDRVEVAVVAGGFERGEHRRVVATSGVARRVDRPCDQREGARRDHHRRARRVVETTQLARRPEARPARFAHFERVGRERAECRHRSFVGADREHLDVGAHRSEASWRRERGFGHRVHRTDVARTPRSGT